MAVLFAGFSESISIHPSRRASNKYRGVEGVFVPLVTERSEHLGGSVSCFFHRCRPHRFVASRGNDFPEAVNVWLGSAPDGLMLKWLARLS
jgi:hypothetical protein